MQTQIMQKKSNSQGKRGVQDKKKRSKWFKNFLRRLWRRLHLLFSTHKMIFFLPEKKIENAKKCKKCNLQGKKALSDKNAKKKKMQKNACFIGRKRASIFSAQFCIILVNFGRILHIFAFSCIILRNAAVNFPKHHYKTTKTDGKNGPKTG